MSFAVILYAKRGGGKTSTALQVADMVKAHKLKARGILSLRVFGEDDYPGYDLIDIFSGDTFPLVRPNKGAKMAGWETFGNSVYAFSIHGFELANKILEDSASNLGRDTVVFVDEFGRLESSRKGIYKGAIKVMEALQRSGAAVFLCRDDRVQEVHALLGKYLQTIILMEAGHPDSLVNLIITHIGCRF